MHPQKQLVASGETGKNPSICIWDSVALKTVSVLARVSFNFFFGSLLYFILLHFQTTKVGHPILSQGRFPYTRDWCFGLF